MTARAMPEWCADQGEVLRLLRWLHSHDHHGPLEVGEVFDILEKPWHWDTEYQQMCAEQQSKTVHEKASGE